MLPQRQQAVAHEFGRAEDHAAAVMGDAPAVGLRVRVGLRLLQIRNRRVDPVVRVEPAQIDAVVKTGGSSNIPLFTEMLTRIFGVEKVKESNAFTSVVAGLAIKAYSGG